MLFFAKHSKLWQEEMKSYVVLLKAFQEVGFSKATLSNGSIMSEFALFHIKD